MKKSGRWCFGFKELSLVERLARMQKGHAATWHNAFGDCGPGGMERVFVKRLAFLHFGFSGRAHLHLGDTAGELGEAFLKLLAIVVAVSLRDLLADQLAASLDRLLVAGALGYRGVFGIDLHLFGAAKLRKLDVRKVDSQVLEDRFTLGEHGQVLEHRLAAVAISRCLHGAHGNDSLELVKHQGGERLSFDILGDNQERGFGLADQFENRNKVLGVGDLFLMDEDVGVFQLADHFLLVGDEVGGNVAPVELHALNDDNLGFGGLAFLDGDHAITGADLVHRFGEFLADFAVVVRRDRRHLGDHTLVLGVDLLGDLVKSVNHLGDAFVNSARQGHGIVTGGNKLEPFAEDGLGQHRGRGGSVPGDIAGLAGGLLDELGTHVLIRVLKLDILGYGYTVLGHIGAAPALVENGIAATGPKGRAHRARQLAGSAQKLLPCVVTVNQLLCTHSLNSFISTQAAMARTRKT